jgi:hypothetical protein
MLLLQTQWRVARRQQTLRQLERQTLLRLEQHLLTLWLAGRHQQTLRQLERQTLLRLES